MNRHARVAVVTGGSRGLGREIAILLGKHGYNVAVNYLHSGQRADEVVSKIGRNAMAVRADVGDLKAVEKMAEIVKEKWGRLDALINNAGITKDTLMIKHSESDWDEVMRTNLKGCFNAVKAFVPLMTAGGHVINISSLSGMRGKPGQAAYSSSKAALIGLSYSLAKELGASNIKVNCVLPGYMPTDMGGNASKAIEEAREKSILKSLSDPRMTAEFIHYLLATEQITGQVFILDSRI